LDNEVIEHETDLLARQLDSWHDNLPGDAQLTESNLVEHNRRGTGGPFIALHLGFHHYATLLYYQYLDTDRSPRFAAKCKYHAVSYSTLLARARKQSGCEVVYPTVGHMAIVSSSVLVHTLLFGTTEELPQSRYCLNTNFEALLELEQYWPTVKTMLLLSLSLSLFLLIPV
jgi:hypothetical protein